MHRVAIDLEPQITGVGQALHDAVDRADAQARDIHEADMVERLAAGGLQHVAGVRACELEPGAAVRQVFDLYTVLMGKEPAHVDGLGAVGAGDLEFGVREAGEREIADDAGAGRQHGRQADPARFGHATGKDAVEPGAGIGAADPVFAEILQFVDADAAAHGTPLAGGGGKGVRASESRGHDRGLIA